MAVAPANSMRRLRDDTQPLDEFRRQAEKIEADSVKEELRTGAKPRLSSRHEQDESIYVIDWGKSVPNGDILVNTTGLAGLPTPQIRTLFAPPDIPEPETVSTLTELFTRYEIPSAFISEGLQNVSQSFGVLKDDNGIEYVWFHFLLKNVALSIDKDGLRRIVDPANTTQSQGNFTWVKAGVVLKLEDPSKASGSSGGGTPASALGAKQVTLLCFGVPGPLYDHLKRLREVTSCETIGRNPYILLDIVFEELHKVLDRIGWSVADVFGYDETETLENASNTHGSEKKIDFTGLHHLAKHTIYLRENCESALCTLENVCAHHKLLIGKTPSMLEESTQRALEYRKTMFQSTQRRLESLEKRMQNIIQLSFHLETQRDSQSMKTVAVMMLIFTPLGTVAAIFGTQLIKIEDTTPYRVVVSQDFWLLWVVAIPLTILVVAIWRGWHTYAVLQLKTLEENFEIAAKKRQKGARNMA